LSKLYSSFSSWSVNPTDSTGRQQVITAAQSFSQAFNAASSNIGQIRSQTDQQLAGAVNQINQYSAQIASINTQIRQGGGPNAGLETRLYNTVEQLSSLASVSVHPETDGTSTVLLDGQIPLVIGQNQKPLSLTNTQSSGATYPNAAPDAQVLNADGQDVTSLISQGSLGALLNFRNNTIPSVIGDGQQQGSLNQLAQGVAREYAAD
jgi:flagellar hook-associated protein 1 FlgK